MRLEGPDSILGPMLAMATDRGTALAPVPLPEAAFLFADIAGFTAYTETHGDVRAAQLAWRLRLGVEAQLGMPIRLNV